MSHPRRIRPLRLTALLAVAAITILSLGGCGLTGRHTLTGVTQDQLANGNEPYFNVGGVTYQVQDSRALNPFSDDYYYFTGLPSAQNIPAADFWYGIFLWAKNQNATARETAGKFVLTDSSGRSYSPQALPAINPFNWVQTSLAQNQIYPDPDSIAGTSTTAGGMLLFLLPDTVYQNRPLTLHIYTPGTEKSSDVDLDL